MRPFKRTPLSAAFLILAMAFLLGWLVAMIWTAYAVIDMSFHLNRGSTPEGLLFGLVVTFGCYMAYLAANLIARAIKYPRVKDGPNSLV